MAAAALRFRIAGLPLRMCSAHAGPAAWNCDSSGSGRARILLAGSSAGERPGARALSRLEHLQPANNCEQCDERANILAQSDAMRSSGLGEHGFQYINLDAGWNDGEDGYGRPLFSSATFPTFIDMIRHIHANGQKVEIYLNPGISKTAVQQNHSHLWGELPRQDIVALPVTSANVFGDADKIDYTKPGRRHTSTR